MPGRNASESLGTHAQGLIRTALSLRLQASAGPSLSFSPSLAGVAMSLVLMKLHNWYQCLQGSDGSGGPDSSAARSVLDAVPDFSAAPLEQGGRARQRMQQQSAQRESEEDSTKASGPNQVRQQDRAWQ